MAVGTRLLTASVRLMAVGTRLLTASVMLMAVSRRLMTASVGHGIAVVRLVAAVDSGRPWRNAATDAGGGHVA
jgi:hypothetical protein